jgi:hypothetical protein
VNERNGRAPGEAFDVLHLAHDCHPPTEASKLVSSKKENESYRNVTPHRDIVQRRSDGRSPVAVFGRRSPQTTLRIPSSVRGALF